MGEDPADEEATVPGGSVDGGSQWAGSSGGCWRQQARSSYGYRRVL